MPHSLEIQTRHYEATARLWYKFLYQRNWYYFVFIFVASVAAIFTHSKQGIHNILAETLSVQLKVPADQIAAALPFRVIYCFIAFCVVFALTMLCHRAERAHRLAAYLRRLEGDIRAQAAITADQIAFTFFDPEESFYMAVVSWIFFLLLVTPVFFLILGGAISHLPASLPNLRSWTDTIGWLDATFEFWIDLGTLALVGVLLIAYFTRAHRYH